ncbi:glycosyltransferase family 2 protein [Frigidibacter sp. SD6-1]|uniref:glycosyltransferase n=1 Tax=Frigidibacter sp. SD6-1 TaxID=3032581 RepID=UPI0024DFB12E|nr:glycosyltransferase family 2 protein [Frigidibacter sp. SD6-1]
MTAVPTISVIVPAFRAEHLLPRVLEPLMAMHKRGEVMEVIVVDDRSPDRTGEVARIMGARVIVTPKNGGPGVARNLAAKAAAGEVLWFVDSDVIAWPDGARRLQATFADPSVAAVFGSYDTTPEGSWFARYKNLMHRYYHQTARRTARTFWAGCGAVRADWFAKVGGFDVETYRVPSIEDIELGYRIHAAGGVICVDPALLGKHLKQWTIRQAIHTDIFRRALPWSRLMIAREGLSDDLNTSRRERARAVLAGTFLLSVLLMPLIGWGWAAGLLALVLVANWPLLAFFVAHLGLLRAFLAILYHQVYYVYSAGAFAWCLIEYHVFGVRNRLHVP